MVIVAYIKIYMIIAGPRKLATLYPCKGGPVCGSRAICNHNIDILPSCNVDMLNRCLCAEHVAQHQHFFLSPCSAAHCVCCLMLFSFHLNT